MLFRFAPEHALVGTLPPGTRLRWKGETVNESLIATAHSLTRLDSEYPDTGPNSALTTPRLSVSDPFSFKVSRDEHTAIRIALVRGRASRA